jgi:HSP20 family protein
MAKSMLVRNGSGTMLDELVTWMGLAPLEPHVRVEEYDEDGRHVVRADIPGVDPDKDIEVKVEHGLLFVRGERRAEEHDGHRSEIRYGSFERVVGLPTGTSPADITAEYADGVLTVTMPTGGPDEATTVPVTRQDRTA